MSRVRKPQQFAFCRYEGCQRPFPLLPHIASERQHYCSRDCTVLSRSTPIDCPHCGAPDAAIRLPRDMEMRPGWRCRRCREEWRTVP